MLRCYHHNDLDGCCAAYILNSFLACDKFYKMDYSDISSVEEVRKDDIVFVLDYYFPRKTFEKILLKTSSVYLIDHHISGIEQTKGLSIMGLQNTYFSGCELTFAFMLKGTGNLSRSDIEEVLKEAPTAVLYVGQRDSWRERKPEADFFCFGAELYDISPQSGFWDIAVRAPDEIIKSGKIISKWKRQSYCRDVNTIGFQTTFEGYKTIVVNTTAKSSEVFDSFNGEVEVKAVFVFDGRRYRVSLYSNSVDVSKIAKKYGGGGHKEAAGFVVTKPPFKELSKV